MAATVASAAPATDSLPFDRFNRSLDDVDDTAPVAGPSRPRWSEPEPLDVVGRTRRIPNGGAVEIGAVHVRAAKEQRPFPPAAGECGDEEDDGLDRRRTSAAGRDEARDGKRPLDGAVTRTRSRSRERLDAGTGERLEKDGGPSGRIPPSTGTVFSSHPAPLPSDISPTMSSHPPQMRIPRPPPLALRRFSSSSVRSSGTHTTETSRTAGGKSETSVLTSTTAPTTLLELEMDGQEVTPTQTTVRAEDQSARSSGQGKDKGLMAWVPMVRIPSRKGKERAHRGDQDDFAATLRAQRGPRDPEALSAGLTVPPPTFTPPEASPASLETTKSSPGAGVTFELSTFPPSYADPTVSGGTTTRPDTTASHISSVGAHSTASRVPLIPTDEETRNRLALLGYSQELNRDWDLWSSVSLTVMNLGTLQGSLWGLVTAMVCGGPVVMSTGTFAGGLVILSTVAVLGEFASAYPVAGAMFTWVFKLARASEKTRDWARFLSWMTGSFLLVAHLFSQVIICWQLSTELQGTINGAGTHIGTAAWVQFLLAIGFIGVSGALACFAFSRTPALWKGLGIVYLAVYIITCVSLVATSAQRNSVSWVFSKYVNKTRYDSRGFVYLLGWVYTSLLIGSESAAHIAEETKQPAKTVPLSMFLSSLISYTLTWIANICVLVALPDPNGSLDVPTQLVSGKRGAHVWEVAELIYANCPRHFAILILSGAIFVQFCCNVAQLYAATRFLWALARDSAIPFASLLRKVQGQARVPRAAAATFTAMSMILSVPIIATFNSGGTLVVSAIFTSTLYFIALSYLIPIGVYLTCPADVLHTDGRNTWTLRQWSRPLACLSIALLLLCIGLMAVPTSLPVTAESWSWSPAVTVVATVLASLSWVFYGNSHYAGPIKSITLWTTGREVGLPRAKSRATRKTKTDENDPTSDVVMDKTTTMGKGATAAIFEGSLPTVASGMEDTYWSESGIESGWTETSEYSRTGHESDAEAQRSRIPSTRRSFARTDSS